MAEFQSPRKRPRPIEFDDISSIDQVSDGYAAKIHGVVMSVSPIKKGKSSKQFFDGYVSDGSKKLRFVGFDAAQAKQLQEFSKEQQPVALTNCCVNTSRYGDQFEILVGDSTDISKSEKTFNVDEAEASSSYEPECKLITINELQPFQKVSLSAKVIELDDIITLNDGRRVQNVFISDSNGRAKLSLWEDNIDSVQLEKSYSFINLVVKTYNDSNTLFTPKQGLSIEEVDDLDKALPLLESIKKTKTLNDVHIIAVTKFCSGYICILCNKSTLEQLAETPTLGRCSNCHSTVLKSCCKHQVSASLQISANTFNFKVCASGVHLSAIAQQPLESVTEASLRLAAPFNATYTVNNMTITNISRSICPDFDQK